MFRLLNNTITGGAELEGSLAAAIIVSDSDDVYGVFSIQNNRGIVVDDQENTRYVTTFYYNFSFTKLNNCNTGVSSVWSIIIVHLKKSEPIWRFI